MHLALLLETSAKFGIALRLMLKKPLQRLTPETAERVLSFGIAFSKEEWWQVNLHLTDALSLEEFEDNWSLTMVINKLQELLAMG